MKRHESFTTESTIFSILSFSRCNRLSLIVLLTTSASAWSANNHCAKELVVEAPGRRASTMIDKSGFELLGVNPISIREVSGVTFTDTNRTDWQKGPPVGIEAVQSYLDDARKKREHFRRNCQSSTPGYCDAIIDSYAKREAWLQCVASLGLAGNSASGDKQSGSSAIGGRPPSDISAGVDEVTPQVPGCPKYVSKLNIEWRRKPGANPQLNVWEARNVSAKFTFRVTYRVDGANTDLPTLNPGDVAEAWGLKGEPPYVVRNFYDMGHWEKANSQQKSLECSLAIRPQ